MSDALLDLGRQLDDAIDRNDTAEIERLEGEVRCCALHACARQYSERLLKIAEAKRNIVSIAREWHRNPGTFSLQELYIAVEYLKEVGSK